MSSDIDPRETERAGLPVFWLSWWEPHEGGEHGRNHPDVTVWTSGQRIDDDYLSKCARVVAKNFDKAWKAVDVMYPGASKLTRRFEQRKPPGWWPEPTRFKRGTPLSEPAP